MEENLHSNKESFSPTPGENFTFLIIQQKMIGDVLTSSILFEALRKKYPFATLHYLIYPHTKPVIENNPYIDKIILFKADILKNPLAFKKFLNSIKAENYYAVIDVYSKISTAMITAASKAQFRISYRKWYTKAFYSHTFSYKKKAETNAGLAIEHRLMLLQGLPKDFPLQIKPKIYLSEKEQSSAAKILKDAGLDKKNCIMIGALGSSDTKTYPLPYLAEIIDNMVSHYSLEILFNYIPRQKEKVLKIAQYCSPATRHHLHLEIFGENLREFMALSAHCCAYFGNEGGAANMAKALNIPTFSIFSPPIHKEEWSSFEDGMKYVGVHLKDFQPQHFYGKNKKQLKEQSGLLYKEFKPELILPKLNNFLKRNVKNSI